MQAVTKTEGSLMMVHISHQRTETLNYTNQEQLPGLQEQRDGSH